MFQLRQLLPAKIKNSSFYVGFCGISRLGPAFIFLRLFKVAHICIQITSQMKARNQSQIFNRKSNSRNTTHRQSLHLQAMLTGETLKG